MQGRDLIFLFSVGCWVFFQSFAPSMNYSQLEGEGARSLKPGDAEAHLSLSRTTGRGFLDLWKVLFGLGI